MVNKEDKIETCLKKIDLINSYLHMNIIRKHNILVNE